MTKTIAVMFGILNFGYWKLFEVCYLEFVILFSPVLRTNRSSIQAKD